MLTGRPRVDLGATLIANSRNTANQPLLATRRGATRRSQSDLGRHSHGPGQLSGFREPLLQCPLRPLLNFCRLRFADNDNPDSGVATDCKCTMKMATASDFSLKKGRHNGNGAPAPPEACQPTMPQWSDTASSTDPAPPAAPTRQAGPSPRGCASSPARPAAQPGPRSPRPARSPRCASTPPSS